MKAFFLPFATCKINVCMINVSDGLAYRLTYVILFGHDVVNVALIYEQLFIIMSGHFRSHSLCWDAECEFGWQCFLVGGEGSGRLCLLYCFYIGYVCYPYVSNLFSLEESY